MSLPFFGLFCNGDSVIQTGVSEKRIGKALLHIPMLPLRLEEEVPPRHVRSQSWPSCSIVAQALVDDEGWHMVDVGAAHAFGQRVQMRFEFGRSVASSVCASFSLLVLLHRFTSEEIAQTTCGEDGSKKLSQASGGGIRTLLEQERRP